MKKEAKLIKREEAAQTDIDYWKSKTPEERLDCLQEIREQYIKLFNKTKAYNEARRGLRRVYRIVERT